MLKAAIFDFDGLLLDTETPWYHVFKEVYVLCGLDLPMELWARHVGSSLDAFNPYEYLKEHVDEPIDLVQIQSHLEMRYEQRMENAQLRPGVLKLLYKAREVGMKIAVASSSTHDWVSGYLKSFGLMSLFDEVVTSDDVKRVKPDPELYKLAMHKLGVSSFETIAFEDSPNGLKAANAAGIRCIIVPNEVTKELEFPPYERRLNSLLEFDLDQFLFESGLSDPA
ncbi:HAD family hydrolase [Paenibacillus alba]|uniref:HAD family hydrolase n=1 Tax=Paenibacillus alba TaxID=1197127 RepID=UPI0015663EE9|nr:HAD family hydrolase [Paenibacillus alba]NQX67155.1 HAD family hydrolase [Paenibacillus alba]